MLQGEGAEKYARFFGYQAVEETSGQNLPLIGTDEVGNGSYFGGLAVVASFVTPDQHAFLRKLGVGDSKTLTDQKIRQIAPVLKEKNPAPGIAALTKQVQRGHRRSLQCCFC